MRHKVIEYIRSKYGVEYEQPWMKDPDNITFKAYNDKWFALILPVKKKQLISGCQDGDEVIDVLNVKAPEDYILFITGTKGYFPAYHMNKRHWLSIMLDGTVNFDEVKASVDESYRIVTDSPTQRIYEAVKKIPRGFVATYGQVAQMAGNAKMSRAVGNALHKNPDPVNIPCFRVVNSKGEISKAFAFGGENEQEKRLIEDGVEVVGGRVDLDKFGMKL